jgi:HSP20 family protein
MIDRWFDESLTRSMEEWPEQRGFDLSVPIDVYETDDNFVVKAELPGLKPEDVDISITGNTLTLKGEFEEEQERERGNVHVQERRFGRFYRSIGLPTNVNTDAAEANFDDGVLKVTLPKTEQAKPKRISVHGKGKSK